MHKHPTTIMRDQKIASEASQCALVQIGTGHHPCWKSISNSRLSIMQPKLVHHATRQINQYIAGLCVFYISIQSFWDCARSLSGCPRAEKFSDSTDYLSQSCICGLFPYRFVVSDQLKKGFSYTFRKPQLPDSVEKEVGASYVLARNHIIPTLPIGPKLEFYIFPALCPPPAPTEQA